MGSPNIRIAPNTSQKFILATVQDGSENVTFLWGNPDIEWHKEIAEEIRDAGFNITKIKGGGSIELSLVDKTIRVWGKSDRYGIAPIEAVKGTLESGFPDYVIEIEE